MINKWGVSNFKSVKDSVELDFGALTLFVGQNSAGKSTIIQSILLTAQTLQSTSPSRSVVLNGRIVRLGSFADIRANGSGQDSIDIKFSLTPPTFGADGGQATPRQTGVAGSPYQASVYLEKMLSVSGSYSFSAGMFSEAIPQLLLQPRLEHGSLSYSSEDSTFDAQISYQRHGRSRESELRRLGITQADIALPDLSAIDFAAGPQPLVSKPLRASIDANSTPGGVVLRHFIPISLASAYDAVTAEVEAIFDLLVDVDGAFKSRQLTPRLLAEALSTPSFRTIAIAAYTNATDRLSVDLKLRAVDSIDELANDFTFENLAKAQAALHPQGRKALLIQLTERSAELKSLLRGGRPARREISSSPIGDVLSFAGNYVEYFFAENIKYLGPLRDEPKSIYPLAGQSDPRDVGFRGEYTAAVFEDNKDSVVEYISSKAFPVGDETISRPRGARLADAVGDWLNYLGIAGEIGTTDKGKLGHELTIRTGSEGFHHDLTHVGVGVSQALPIVVSSLLASSGTTLIFEQPELHLNPRVQTRLADFFVSLILAGKQCIIETHSEYLVSRLRLLVARADDVVLSKTIRIFFVEKHGDQSSYRDIRVSERGVIVDWPSGFFDESEKTATEIIRVQIDRARKRKRLGDDKVS